MRRMHLIRLWLIFLALSSSGFDHVLAEAPPNATRSGHTDDALTTTATSAAASGTTKAAKRPAKVAAPVAVAEDEAAGEDIDEDYNVDYVDEAETTRQSRQRNVNVARRVGTTYAWDKWEKWSKCTRSCVQIRRRPCVERIQNDTASEPLERRFYPDLLPPSERQGCRGVVKKYRLCKDEKCRAASSRELRDEQCANFNRIAYRGKFHSWRGYEKEHNECELFCRPVGSEAFVSMNRSVTDGTPCERPAVFYTHAYRRRAVCVEGICRAVHSSGAIRPATTNDSRHKCGSVLCQVVSELFSKSKLGYGYNYVATIPAGAMNLTIKQMARSDNLLALKSTEDVFIINGHQRASESGTFDYNEDSYDYSRELGMITAKGPLSRAVVLLLFVRGLNTGVKYDYTLPVPSASVSEDEELQTQWNELGQPLDEIEDNNIVVDAASPTTASGQPQITRVKDRKRRKFSWKLLGFGQCNRSCGPGVQPPIFRCIRDSPTRYYSPKRCAFAEKPVFSEDIYQCNRGLCPAYWRAGDYGECTCVEGEVDGQRRRRVQCVQEQATGRVEEVADALCFGEKLPDLTETCNCPRQIRRRIYARGPDKTAKVYSRLIGSAAAAAAATGRNAYHGNGNGSSSSGSIGSYSGGISSNNPESSGVTSLVLSGSGAPLRRQFRDDRVDKAGVWLMSEWDEDECAAATCAGSGVGVAFQHRSIYCDRTAPFTDLCDLRYTPEQRRSCNGHSERHDRTDCRRGVWFASEWSNCSGDCFNLQRRRQVLCLIDGVAVEESECGGALERPREVANCTHKEVAHCGPKWHYSEWSECSRSCGEGIQRRYAKCLEYDWKQNALVESNSCKYLEREPVYGACNVQKCEELDTPLSAVQNDPATPADDCSDEFSNCRRINRQRLCKLQYYQTYCCQTCAGYF